MKSPKKEKATTAKQENSPRFPVLPLSTHGCSVDSVLFTIFDCMYPQSFECKQH
eukprot:m.106962 g.106962  ORF g.106962 m.106962 type:complete len:54 (+) comp13906_c0_seq1:2306-2467(+)